MHSVIFGFLIVKTLRLHNFAFLYHMKRPKNASEVSGSNGGRKLKNIIVIC